MLGKNLDELLNLQEKEIRPMVRKLNTFNKEIRKDIKKKMISEPDGEELISKVTSLVRVLTNI